MNGLGSHEYRGAHTVHEKLEAAEKLIEQLESALREVLGYSEQGFPTGHMAIEALAAAKKWREQ